MSDAVLGTTLGQPRTMRRAPRAQWPTGAGKARPTAHPEADVVRVDLIAASPLIAEGFEHCLAGTDPVLALRIAPDPGSDRPVSSADGEVRVIDGVSQPVAAELRVASLRRADPKTTLVVLVGGYGAGEAARFVRAGASACLPVGLPRVQLRNRLVAIIRGEASTDITGPRLQACAKREGEVLSLLVAGFRSNEIAPMLGMQSSTVASHLQNLRGKLGARSTPELVAIAARLGLVS